MSEMTPSPQPGDESREPTPDIPPIRMKRINYENLFTDKERSNQKRLAQIFSVDQTNKVFTADGLRIMEDRANMIDAEFDMGHGEGGGTYVRCRLSHAALPVEVPTEPTPVTPATAPMNRKSSVRASSTSSSLSDWRSRSTR